MADRQLIKAQAVIRGHLSRSSLVAEQIRLGKQARATAVEKGEAVPPTPFMPTPHNVIRELLQAASVSPSSVVLDMGCGDGRVPIAAARECGARGIGIESLPHVYDKARTNRDEAGLSEQQVELYCADFSKSEDAHVIDECLDRANVVFVFLLPTVMPQILQLILRSIRRKHSRAQAAASAPASAQPLTDERPASSSDPLACPCHPSVRTRAASWTFSLSDGSSTAGGLLALPLPAPSRSVVLESAHTKLHLYDLCACILNEHEHEHDERGGDEGHAARIAREFAPQDVIALAAPSGAASTGGGTAPPAAVPLSAASSPLLSPTRVDVSSIPWGHALNSSTLLRARWAATQGRGLFVEADLRVRAGAAAAAAVTASSAGDSVLRIEDVILAHDAGDPGEPFTQWYATFRSLTSSDDAPAPSSSSARPPALGLKLDFKMLEAVQPVLSFLRREEVAGRPAVRHPSLLWLNADVLPGPGFAPDARATVEADAFMRTCSEVWPEAVLSIGWNTRAPDSAHATTQRPDAAAAAASLMSSSALDLSSLHYTHAHVSAMMSLLRRYPTAHQVTFPLRASLIRRSWACGTLQRLLAACPHSTLTVWTSRAEQLEPGAADEEAWIKEQLPKHRTFIDLVLD